jgi:hypothetical protein
MVQLFSSRSDGPASCTYLLRLDATSVIPPRVALFLLGTSARVLRPKPINRPPMVLRPKPSNRPWVAYSIRIPRRSTCVTAVLYWPTAKSSWAPLDSHVRRLDSVNTVTPMYTCACRCPQMSATAASHLASWSLGLSLTSVLHRSWSIGTARLPWPSPRRRPPPPSSTPAHHKPRDMSHNPTHAMIRSHTQSGS